MSVFVSLKKPALLGSLILGSGFTSALVFGDKNDKLQEIILKILPLSNDSLSIYKSLQKITTLKFSQIFSPNDSHHFKVIPTNNDKKQENCISESTDENIDLIRFNYEHEFDELQRKLYSEIEMKQKIKSNLRAAINAAVSKAREEFEDDLMLEKKRIYLEQSNLRLIEMKAFVDRITVLDKKLDRIMQTFQKRISFEALSSPIRSLALLFNESSFDEKLFDSFLRNITELENLTKDESVLSISSSLKCTLAKKSKRTIKSLHPKEILSRFRDAKNSAALYNDYDGCGMHTIFPVLKFRSSDSDLYLLKRLDSIESSLTTSSIEKAVKELNMINGWSRIILNDIIEDCRIWLEMHQGISVLEAILLENTTANKL